MHSELAISAQNLGKTFRVFGHPGDRIKQALSFGRIRLHREFTALRDVSFDVKKGETVGIIGRNGSGKSTLLQLVCGVLKPTSGKVEANGRISALLELGSGFNPEFTGRENVYFQGAVSGIDKKEMAARFDDIAAFAEIGEFIDQPVRTYSSGMFVKLAFAVAIHVDPDILIVDEALAVGDAAFQSKCFQRIRGFQKSGGSILLVTHSLEQVGHFCDRVLLLDSGTLLADGSTSETLTTYTNRIAKGAARVIDRPAKDDQFSDHPAYVSSETRWGGGAATIDDISLTQAGVVNPDKFLAGLETELVLTIRYHAIVDRPVYGLTVKSADGAQLFTANSLQSPGAAVVRAQKAGDVVRACFRFNPFFDSGHYLISVGVAGETQDGLIAHDRRYDSIDFHIAHPLTPSQEVAVRSTFTLL
ncbi:ABC transporter ATP-binding protein [Ramlibacter sp. WS9]|uniref:ABC transporter ATP-binding protein n=1 Tax=Ramlibacter sp. WS9 TaxID=1882741 RepID=UPI0011440DEB|nr:ABC transporter ATP-binding protein [Ramlibacter sp. WS9]ROZ79130.1 ABC transporter ATP-binding protein [Ramlibacter sp. WS9]